MTYLLDTNAISEITKPSPDPAFMAWFTDQEADELFISVITLGELRRGTALLAPGDKRRRYEAVHRGLARTFADRILPIDEPAALLWGELSARHRQLGRAPTVADELIAATALARDLVIVTRNVRDFEPSGCKLIAPWMTR